MRGWGGRVDGSGFEIHCYLNAMSGWWSEADENKPEMVVD